MDTSPPVSARTTIVNPLGMHARSATAFTQIAGRYAGCTITVTRVDTGADADGTSIMSLLQLILEPGTEIEITVHGGAAAEPALAELVALVDDGFGEM